jgi:hypothetical protein
MSAGRWGVVIAVLAVLALAGVAVYLKVRPAPVVVSSVTGHATVVEPSAAPPTASTMTMPPVEPPAATPAPAEPRASAAPSSRPRVVADVPAAKEVPAAKDVPAAKQVKLDQAVDVVHRHGVGSCQGRLVATAAGLQYETDRGEDAFTKPFAELEPLEVDYPKKNLRVKIRGGKTYNFTTKAANADDLVKFQQAVEAARQ